MKPVKVLFVSSNPHWTERLDLGDEMRELLHSLRGQDVELMPLPAAQREDLEVAVTSSDVDVLHFSGHATTKDGLILRDEDGMEVSMSGAELRELIQNKKIKLAFLNACSTEETANAIKDDVGAVIGTTRPLDDRAAKKMTKVFYSELGTGHTIDEAFDEAADTITKEGLSNVYMRTGRATAEPLLSRTPSDEFGVRIKNQAYYDKFFFISYLDEQIRDLKGRIRLNRWIFRALLVFGAAFLGFVWFSDIDKLAVALNIFGQERINTYTGKPYLDSLIAIGAAIPILLSFFQTRLSIHASVELRSLTQMKELVKSAENLSPEMQTRLRVIMDQCIRGADREYKPIVDWFGLFESLANSGKNKQPPGNTAG